MSERPATNWVAWLALTVSFLGLALSAWTWIRGEVRWEQDGGVILVKDVGIGRWERSADSGELNYTQFADDLIRRDMIDGTATVYFAVRLESRGRDSAVFRSAGFEADGMRYPSGAVFCLPPNEDGASSTEACDLPMRIESGDDQTVLIGMDSLTYDRLICAGHGGQVLRPYVESLIDYPTWATEVKISAEDQCVGSNPSPQPTP